jgi:hypothetical protein
MPRPLLRSPNTHECEFTGWTGAIPEANALLCRASRWSSARHLTDVIPDYSMRRFPGWCLTVAVTVLGLFTLSGPFAQAAGAKLRLEAKAFRIVPSESGPVNYFQRVDSPTGDFIRASYKPPYKTAVLGVEIPEDFRQGLTNLTWRWRAVALPAGANECAKGKSDSAAVVYVTWRRGLRWYALKYVWSSNAKKGSVCEKKRNPFRAQDTVVLESGEPTNTWKTVSINPAAEFRAHFENGDASAEVPDLIGIGLMSDGDQTQSDSSADYADFVLSK